MTIYEDPATFRGQLQRGRGEAVRRAPQEPDAADAVYECVISDTRWDRQVEQRDDYLAGLIRQLGLSLAPLERHLAVFEGEDVDDKDDKGAEEGEGVELALQVLALLRHVGYRDAAEVLRRYARGGEREGQYALSAIWDGDARADGDAGADGDAQAFGRGRGAAGSELRRRRQALSEVATPELARRLSVVSGDAGERRDRGLMLEELGRRGEMLVLELAEDPGMRNAAGWIPGMARALDHLGAAAVPRARIWVAADTGLAGLRLAELGIRVLSGHGGPGDVPVLHEALRRALADEDWCLAEIPARGLGRLRAGGTVADDLVSAWETTAHSRAREAFLAALRDCAPGRAEALAEEGLFDCESSVRELACACAADNDVVRARLAQLAEDSLLPDTRDAARARLALLGSTTSPHTSRSDGP